MKPRLRFVVPVAAALVLAAVLAPCDDAPDPPDTPEPSPRSADVTDRTTLGERTGRRRVTRPPEQAGGAVTPRVAWVDPSVSGDAPAPATEDAPTGRVRVLMLKDGEPFRGGHVCFYPEEVFVEPAPWDGVSSSDGAYFGIPYYKGLWPHFDPVLGSGGPVTSFSVVRGVTGADGIVTLDVPPDRTFVTFVRYRMGGIPLKANPRVRLAAGEELDVTIEAARERVVAGRCVDQDGAPLAGILVQALHPLEERPLSRVLESQADGSFELPVFGEDSEVRLRAMVNTVKHPLGIHDTASQVPPIPADTTLVGVVPGGGPVEVRMPPAPLTFIELTVAEGESPLQHMQIEGLVFDRRASAWGRLGGPQYRRAVRGGGGRTAVIALPRAEAVRPLMLWSWGWTITSVDPRGRDRVSVEFPRGRTAGVRGSGWRATDRLRVVAFCGPEGAELPCIWIEDPLGYLDRWSRDDSPVTEIEFQIVRDGMVVGRSARVPAGAEPADDVVIDLD